MSSIGDKMQSSLRRISNAGYSTLEFNERADDLPEVVYNPHGDFAERLGSGTLQVDQDAKASQMPQAITETGPIYHAPHEFSPIPAYFDESKGTFGTEPESGNRRHGGARICGLRRRVFRIVFGIAAFIIILAAILGGVLGASAGKSSADHPSNNQVDAPVIVATTTSTSPSTSTTTTSSAPAATTTGYTGLRSDSHIAAISFDYGQGGQQYAVYYQDERNSIKQSLWNSSLQTWNVSSVWTAADVMSGGTFSSAVNFANGVYQIELYYLGTDNTLKELYFTNGATEWKPGFATAQNYAAFTSSGLALADNLCPGYCSNNLLWFWQDPEKNIRIGNSSVAVGLNDNIIVKNALTGTPISATPFPMGDGPLNYALFYYNSNSQLEVSLWSPSRVKNLSNSTGQGWSQPTVLGSVSSVGQLTSFSSSSDTDSTITLINSAEDGLQVTSLAVNAQGSVSTKSSESTSIIDSWRNFTSIAVNVENQLFGVVNGTIQHYSMQGSSQTWSLVGTVPTK